LALEYQDFVTTFVIMVGRPAKDKNKMVQPQEIDTLLQSTMEERNKNMDVEHASTWNGKQSDLDDNDDVWDLYCLGTGFALLPNNNSNTSLLLSMLNVTQVPSIIVIDTATGRQVGGDVALLAMVSNRDNPQRILQAWEQGKSGLSCCETLLAMATCQTSVWCVIQ
jgi:hypothetical protein